MSIYVSQFGFLRALHPDIFEQPQNMVFSTTSVVAVVDCMMLLGEVILTADIETDSKSFFLNYTKLQPR